MNLKIASKSKYKYVIANIVPVFGQDSDKELMSTIACVILINCTFTRENIILWILCSLCFNLRLKFTSTSTALSVLENF